MVETAALLVDHVFPHRPIRQWVLSFPLPLRFVLANHQQLMGKVSQAYTGAVTLIQRFGSALNLNLHFHVLFLGIEVSIPRRAPGLQRVWRPELSKAFLLAADDKITDRTILSQIQLNS